jgi:homoserine kinase
MGSSTAALLTGLLAANAMLGTPLDKFDLLDLATSIEGHPDNIAPALFGGLTIGAIKDDQKVMMHQYLIPVMPVLIVLPEVSLLTEEARALLPEMIPREDAIFNHSRTPFLIEALRSGNLSLLAEATRDRLHQPYRFPRIPGSRQALDIARKAGALAATLSGAGPGLLVFPGIRGVWRDCKSIPSCFQQQGSQCFSFDVRTNSLQGCTSGVRGGNRADGHIQQNR